MKACCITVRGRVQGVGFRPTVWRIANDMGLAGDVLNSGDGVRIRLIDGIKSEEFIVRLKNELPLLAAIESVDIQHLKSTAIKISNGFEIIPSKSGEMRTQVTPDAATCKACFEEILDPFANRYRYPFTNCTHCGPRFSIIQSGPYDRAKTTMRDFVMCDICEKEYSDPIDRRFHAQPIACYHCGPKAWIEHLNGGSVHLEAFSMMDDVDAAGGMLLNGHIVAIKGLGGYHIACDASKDEVVSRLRSQKKRPHKAFALMARDIDVIKKYAYVSETESKLLHSPASPIVVLNQRTDTEQIAKSVAPGLKQLGFMLPPTPMHHLLFKRISRPMVMTSGNISGHPQCTSNKQAREQLASVAEFALMHNRAVANRIDDSVIRVNLDHDKNQTIQMLRRARGYAPDPLKLPEGFDHKIQVLALGAELKNTFCLLKDGQAIVSQHMGDLHKVSTNDDVDHNLDLYQQLFDHKPEVIAIDMHPDYHSSHKGRELLAVKNTPSKCLIEVQHHHAHIAACLFENQFPMNTAPVLGIALDGLGMGDDGTFWGGEFLLADYYSYERKSLFKPVPLLGGNQAVIEPWRSAYSHLMAEMGWKEFEMNFSELEIYQKLKIKPRPILDKMKAGGINSPMSSSCGRLFDAAAAISGLIWEKMSYEGQAAMLFEAALDEAALNEPDDLIYPFTTPMLHGNGMPYIETLDTWRAMLGDLILKTPVGIISARFHRGLAKVISKIAINITQQNNIDVVVLSGGCFQNQRLLDLVIEYLGKTQLKIITPQKFPANDGGISLGQAAISLAQYQKSML